MHPGQLGYILSSSTPAKVIPIQCIYNIIMYINTTISIYFIKIINHECDTLITTSNQTVVFTFAVVFIFT